jgi:hypothetical protein
LVNLVDQILTTKAQNPAAEVSAREAEIDQRVYALYGLSVEEIKIVEGEQGAGAGGRSPAQLYATFGIPWHDAV